MWLMLMAFIHYTGRWPPDVGQSVTCQFYTCFERRGPVAVQVVLPGLHYVHTPSSAFNFKLLVAVFGQIRYRIRT